MFTAESNSTKTIGKTDPNFHIRDKFTTCTRASIQINANCPSNIARYVYEAFSKGWIEPVAHVTSEEYTWMTLRRK
jgi:hypothetical protein